MKKLPNKPNGFYLAVFFVIFVCLIVISLCIRGVKNFQDSQLQGNAWNILIQADDMYVLRIDQKEKKMVAMQIQDTSPLDYDLFRLSARVGIPLHGAVIFKENVSFQNFTKEFLSMGNLLSLLFTGKAEFVRMNESDMLKLYIAAKKTKKNQRVQRVVKNYLDDSRIMDQINDQLYELFKDVNVINERTSIEVINATNVSGLAREVAQMLETGGYNIVAIRSGDAQPSAINLAIDENITVKNLKMIFPFQVKEQKKTPIADVSIVIGSDILKD